MDDDVVMPLTTRLPVGHVGSLEHVSSELAAAALTDLFVRTGSAQARVNDVATVRRLVRLDCRRRGCRVRTLGMQGIVVVYDEERYGAFRATEEGSAHVSEMEQRVLATLPGLSARSSSLRLVPPADTAG